jgi:hypothetical protein
MMHGQKSIKPVNMCEGGRKYHHKQKFIYTFL